MRSLALPGDGTTRIRLALYFTKGLGDVVAAESAAIVPASVLLQEGDRFLVVAMTAAEAALMHILSDAEVKRQFQAGMFATAYTCDDDEITGYGLKALYKQSVEMEDCTIFWDRKQ